MGMLGAWLPGRFWSRSLTTICTSRAKSSRWMIHRGMRARAQEIPICRSEVSERWSSTAKLILPLPQTKEIRADKSVSLLDRETLKAGDETGFYVEYFESAGERFSTAAFAVRSPPPQSPGVAKRTLHQLEARKSAAGLLLFPLVSRPDWIIHRLGGRFCMPPAAPGHIVRRRGVVRGRGGGIRFKHDWQHHLLTVKPSGHATGG